MLEKVVKLVKQVYQQMEEIIEYKDGDIKIRFAPQRSVRLNFEKERDLKDPKPRKHFTSSIPLVEFDGIRRTRKQVSQP